MSDSASIVPFGHTGAFTITTGQPGARTLRAILTVPPHTITVNGHGHLSQAVQHPVVANTAFHGVYTVEIFGATAHQNFSLHGTAVPPRPGASYVSSLAITLDGLWGKLGKATYTVIVAEVVEEFKDVPVMVEWLLQ